MTSDSAETKTLQAPVPENEYERLAELLDYGVDFGELQQELSNLTDLAAKVSGAKVSLVNLLDQNTQWSVARSGIELIQMPREDSVCQHTIMSAQRLEIPDLLADERTKDKSYFRGEDGFRFYHGVPLTNKNGVNLGALCVLDDNKRQLDEDQIELLELIAEQVVKRLESIRQIHKLQEVVRLLYEKQRKLGHDVRGPISGVIGVTDVVRDMLNNGSSGEALEMMVMLKESGESLLELVEGILAGSAHKDPRGMYVDSSLSLDDLKKKLLALYQPQAMTKQVELIIDAGEWPHLIGLTRNRLMQIAGNLITNAIKFTPAGGSIGVELDVKREGGKPALIMKVSDTGVGMDEAAVRDVLNENATSTPGTKGEAGYGMGLQLVQRLISEMSGLIKIDSKPGEGCRIRVSIPFVV